MNIILVSGIVNANIYCMYVVAIDHGEYVVRTEFVLIVLPREAYDKSPALILINPVSHFLTYFIH